MNYHPDNFYVYTRSLDRKPRLPRPKTSKFKASDPDRDTILTLIDELGLSDHRIARRCKIAPTTIASWRAGRIARPRHMTLALVLAVLGKRFVIADAR